jgi:hypothetical protein
MTKLIMSNENNNVMIKIMLYNLKQPIMYDCYILTMLHIYTCTYVKLSVIQPSVRPMVDNIEYHEFNIALS